ncbi:MAG: acyl-CoA dehydrogenase C-terminal domain-containing protein [Pseudomonadales bacterium]|nr:acyl-CoA dehydrogenase C-terminal domain-containing protein [Pseudomonadales bacterium]
MSGYRVPLKDIHFLCHQVLGLDEHRIKLSGSEDVSAEELDAIFEEAAKFAENMLAPVNVTGDLQGCSLKNGKVITPEGFRESYKAYVEAGWSGISADPNFGGQGLPTSVGVSVLEMMTTANMAWTLYPELSHGSVLAISAHGSEEQKQIYLTKLISGEWTGTMCLTESHAGSDVGLLSTRAKPRADGSYDISGTKIFISGGEHEMSENIVHLVLARLPDAPSGTKGISLFLVPKYKVSDTGELLDRNTLECSALEEKMGLHGCSTCVMNFDNAQGYLLGSENKGMSCMFTMMNAARIYVGIQGLGLMEGAYQKSLSYAQERVQMRALDGPKNPDQVADPIIVHPDVRKMLLTQKALVEGCRALIYETGRYQDCIKYGADAELRQTAELMVDFYTPIVKGFVTEVAQESTSLALQVFGGHGYIRETGIEQYVRDARITTLYEGTNGIQALDLMGRKTLHTQGKAMMSLVGESRELAGALEQEGFWFADKLRTVTSEWGELTGEIAERVQNDPNELGAAAVDYLMYSGYAVLAIMWGRMALCAKTELSDGKDDDFYQGKLATADFYFKRLLPRCLMHAEAMRAGAGSLMEIDPAGFAHA